MVVADLSTVAIPVGSEAPAAPLEREQLSRLVDAMPSLVWYLTADSEQSYYNKRLVDWFGLALADIGCPGKDLLAAAIESTVHPDDRAAVHERLTRACATGEPFDMKYSQRRSDGAYRLTQCRAEPLRDANGRVVQWYGVVTGVENEVSAQNAVHVARSRLVRAAQAAILAELSASIAHEVNQPLAAIVANAHACQRWLSADPSDIGRARIASECIVRDANAASDVVNRIRALFMRPKSQDGRKKVQHGLPALPGLGIAELSASIAHEVNQPLAAIVANSHACHRWLAAECPNIERAKLAAERITRNANVAAAIVNRIRALFGQSAELKTSAPLTSAIAEARSLLSQEAERHRVRVDVDIEGDLPAVTFDPIQIQQVLINLIRNSMEAMDCVTGDRVVGMRVRRIGDVVQTEISDRGHGIEFPDKVFEPFFTTKENGMGMGLAICRSIVEAHGGRLWAEKNEPQGARFSFTLPVAVNTASRFEAALS